MVLTVLSILFSLGYLLFRDPDPAWAVGSGWFFLVLCAGLAFYFVIDAKRSRPVTNNKAALAIASVTLACSEMLLSIPYDLLRVVFSPVPVAMTPLILALWIGYRNDPLKGIF